MLGFPIGFFELSLFELSPPLPALDDCDGSLLWHTLDQGPGVLREVKLGCEARDKEKRLIADKDAKAREWAASSDDRPTMSAEFLRLSAELSRLRRLLHEHGIEPGDERLERGKPAVGIVQIRAAPIL